MRLHRHGEIHLRWVKSLRDEICPWQMKSSLREGDGLDLYIGLDQVVHRRAGEVSHVKASLRE